MAMNHVTTVFKLSLTTFHPFVFMMILMYYCCVVNDIMLATLKDSSRQKKYNFFNI